MGDILVKLRKAKRPRIGSCCPDPGSGWGNPAAPPASKEAEISSKLYSFIGSIEGGWTKKSQPQLINFHFHIVLSYKCTFR